MDIKIKEKAIQVLSEHCKLRMLEDDGIDERYSEVG